MAKAYIPTLSELQAFVACGHTLSMSKAAKELGLTQSAVSRAVVALENRMGVVLFHRMRQRLILSDTGRAFLRDAESILSNLDQSALRAMSFGARDVIRLHCLPCLAEAWLVPRLAAFNRLSPDVTFDLSTTSEPASDSRAPYDMMFHHPDQAPAGSTIFPLMAEHLIAVASPALARQIRFETEDASLDEENRLLTRYPLLQHETRAHLWLEWFGASQIDPLSFSRGTRFSQFGMIAAAAKAGMGVGLVPEALVAPDLRSANLARVSDRRLQGGQYALILPAERPTEGVALEFRDWLIAQAGETAGPRA